MRLRVRRRPHAVFRGAFLGTVTVFVRHGLHRDRIESHFNHGTAGADHEHDHAVRCYGRHNAIGNQ